MRVGPASKSLYLDDIPRASVSRRGIQTVVRNSPTGMPPPSTVV